MKRNHKFKNQIALLAVGLMAAATAQAALVGHWTFDETSGTNVVDSTINGYDGTVVNPVWATGVDGGGALQMNGTDCQVTGFSSNLLSTVTNEITISFWCAGDLVAPQNMNGFSGYNPENKRMLNAHVPNSTSVYWDAGYSNDTSIVRDRINKYAGSGPLVRGPWNHWAFTKNATTGYMAIYENGALFTDSAATGPFYGNLTNITEFIIGSDGGVNSFYKGLMDDFRVYDNELDATAISNLYTAVTQDYAIAYASSDPTSGSIPLEVVFDGSTSVSTTNITDYAWDFGDGNTGNGMIVTNTYTMIATNTVTLTITDANGNIDSVQLEVESKPVPPIEIAYLTESFDSTNFPSFSTNDLAQVYYLSSSGTIGSDTKTTTDTDHAKLFDGIIIGPAGTDNDETALVMWDDESTVTVDFDVSVNTLGYDITNIVSIAGWKPSSGGRANQGYEVVVTYVDDTQEILAAATDWAPNSPAFYWTRVSLFEENNNVMASGVKSVTFNFSEDANPGGRVMGREIDIHGYPSVPAEPDEPTLGYDGDSLSWNANGDFVYSVQTNLDLVYGEWATFTTVIGTPPTTTFVLPPKNGDQVFYRVIVE